MNNFNIVLKTIKQCCKETNVLNHDCFEKVEYELASIKQTSYMHIYLDFLQDLGLIKYSDEAKQIALTECGRNTDNLFEN